MNKNFFAKKSLGKITREQKTEMSIEKPSKNSFLQSNARKQETAQLPSGLQQVNGNTFVTRLHGLIKDEVVAQSNYILSTQVQTEILGKPLRSRVMTFRQVEYIIPTWTGTGFPNVLYIAHTMTQNIGFATPQGNATKRLAALELTQISPSIQDTGVKSYDLRYSLRDTMTWGIPYDVSKIDFQVLVDDEQTPLQLPLPNPMTISLEFRYERL